MYGVPQLAERAPQAAACDQPSPLLVRDVPAVVDVRERPPRATDLAEEAGVVADDEREALLQPPGPPVLPREVAADDERYSARRAVALERRGLAVVRGQDDAVAPVGRRQAAPRARGLVGELRPAELVLVEGVLPGPGADHRGGRANGQDERRRHGQHGELEGHEPADGGVAGPAPGPQPAAEGHDPRRERDRVAGQRVVAPPALRRGRGASPRPARSRAGAGAAAARARRSRPPRPRLRRSRGRTAPGRDRRRARCPRRSWRSGSTRSGRSASRAAPARRGSAGRRGAATPSASHGPRVASRRRDGVASSPTVNATRSTAIVYFASSPIPATRPSTGHSRGSGRPSTRSAT